MGLQLVNDEEYWLAKAYECATYSLDPSTQTGAILRPRDNPCSAVACNGLITGDTGDLATMPRDEKIRRILHAEEGAILAAANMGLRTGGATLYAPWAPCCGCAKAIVASGITRLVCHKAIMDLTPDRWRDEVLAGLLMLERAKVKVDMCDGPIKDAKEIRFNGSLWKPE